jgi:uncharacterized protein involved in exopolysaccharide biosynthesis
MTNEPDKFREPSLVEEEVDLLEYLHALLRVKYRIVIAAFVVAVSVFGLSKLVTDQFTAVTTVAMNINEDPGGVQPGKYGAADVISLIEHDFLVQTSHSNERDRMLARMRSMTFSEIFIIENNLLPYLFHKQWDAEKKEWKDGFKPEMREAAGIFVDSIRKIALDETTGLLAVSMTTRSAELSADLANKFIKRFNEYIRQKEQDVLSARGDYLNKRLAEIENLELHRSIYRLLETQLASESLLHARDDYPLEVIQPAIPPLFKSKPSRKKWAALSFFAVILLGIVVTIARVLLGKITSGLKAYQQKEIAQVEEQVDTPTAGKGDDWVD